MMHVRTSLVVLLTVSLRRESVKYNYTKVIMTWVRRLYNATP